MSFRVKISVLMTVLVAILFSFGSTSIIHRSYMTSLTREEQEAVNNLRMLISTIQVSYESTGGYSESQLKNTLRKLEKYQTSSDVFLLFRDNNLIYSNSGIEYLDLDVDGLAANLNSSSDIYVSYHNGDYGMEYISSSSEITINDTKYILCVLRDILDITYERQELHSYFMNTFTILLIITGMVSWVMSSFLVRPLKRLARATREIADGDLSFRSNIRTDDEIGELSQDFDKMAENLEQNVTLLEEAAEEKDRFMGAFTHELKTPMTSIIGYSELLRTQELEKEDRDDALDYIYSEAKRLENMSLKLLQIFVSDKEKIDFKNVSPAEIVEDIVVHMSPTLAEQGIKIIFRVENGRAMLEPDLVRTLIINLIDNARKAIDKKGRIRVDQKMTEDGVKFIITDNGKGMPPEAIKHVTEAFYRVDKARSRQQGGAGLGLSLVSKIVELHKGDISFSSEPGIGTVVTVELRTGHPSSTDEYMEDTEIESLEDDITENEEIIENEDITENDDE